MGWRGAYCGMGLDENVGIGRCAWSDPQGMGHFNILFVYMHC